MLGEIEATMLLKRAELRITAPRLAVLAYVHEQPHSDVQTITRAVAMQLGSVSTQTVYDIVGALCEAKLLRRIHVAGYPARFETRVGDNHHHVLCRHCGVLADVDCAVGAAPCLRPAAAYDFSIDETEVIYIGLCPDCSVPDATPTKPAVQMRRENPPAATAPRCAERGEVGRQHECTASPW